MLHRLRRQRGRSGGPRTWVSARSFPHGSEPSQLRARSGRLGRSCLSLGSQRRRLEDPQIVWGRIDLLSLVQNAEVAQLVEHDLAKIGVAGSSPVFRSVDTNPARIHACCSTPCTTHASVLSSIILLTRLRKPTS